MKINNGNTATVKMKWDRITLPLKEGTPVNTGGNIANDGTAIGLVLQNWYVRPVASDEIGILVSGDVELFEIQNSAGIELTNDAKAAMRAIKFHLKSGTVDGAADAEQDEKIAEQNVKIEDLISKEPPWQKNGHWAHGVYDCGTNAWDNDETDEMLQELIIGTTSSIRYLYPASSDEYNFAQVVVIPRGKIGISTNAASHPGSMRFVSDSGNVGVAICPSGLTSGKLDVYLFVVPTSE